MALKLLNRPTSPGWLLPLPTTLATAPCRASQPGAATVLHLQLEAAGAAQAVDRRGAEDAPPAPPGSRGNACRSRSATAFGAQLRVAGALLERLEDDEHAADVGDVGAGQDRVAGHADRVADALGLQGDRRSCASMTASRALQAGAVGELGVDDQVALVLLRDEARRARPGSRGRSGRAGRRRPAGRSTLTRRSSVTTPAVAVGRAVEDPVEAAEEAQPSTALTSAARNQPATPPATNTPTARPRAPAASAVRRPCLAAAVSAGSQCRTAAPRRGVRKNEGQRGRRAGRCPGAAGPPDAWPCSPWPCGLSRIAHSAGLSVSELNAEMIVEAAMVRANCL